MLKIYATSSLVSILSTSFNVTELKTKIVLKSDLTLKDTMQEMTRLLKLKTLNEHLGNYFPLYYGGKAYSCTVKGTEEVVIDIKEKS